MTTPLWCLMFLAIFPIIPLATIGGVARVKQEGKIDNNYPRLGFAKSTGFAARAWAAQQNAWEGLALFTVAVFVTYATGADPEMCATLSIAFVIARLAHAIFYLANIGVLRSVAFLSSLGIVIWMFKLAITAAPAVGS